MSIFNQPAGIVADKSAGFGLSGLINNVNNYSEAIAAITTAGTNTNLTAAQATIGIVILNAGASGGFTVTLPSTTSIISALGATIATDGSYAEPLSIVNNNVGQIGTLTIGDSSTTLVGTMTMATNTRRTFLMTVTGPSTISIQNLGSMGL
jgi:hypothetical protein